MIFLLQAIFAVIQFLPRFRATPMVQQGVSYYYCAVSLFQVGWTFSFAYEVLWLSLLFMLLIWISLCSLLYSQYYTKSDGSLWEFWLLRFPFALHWYVVLVWWCYDALCLFASHSDTHLRLIHYTTHLIHSPVVGLQRHR